MISLLNVDPAKVYVVHHGIRKLAGPVGAPPGREKVILNVGAIQKRKNIARLVESFETLPPPWRLVLAGSSGYGAEEILSRIKSSRARDRIQVTGYVSAEDLAGWYAGQRCSPSLHWTKDSACRYSKRCRRVSP